jgi:hypothetical protein
MVRTRSPTVSQEHSVQVEWFAATCLTSSCCWMLTAYAWNWTGSHMAAAQNVRPRSIPWTIAQIHARGLGEMIHTVPLIYIQK